MKHVDYVQIIQKHVKHVMHINSTITVQIIVQSVNITDGRLSSSHVTHTIELSGRLRTVSCNMSHRQICTTSAISTRKFLAMRLPLLLQTGNCSVLYSDLSLETNITVRLISIELVSSHSAIGNFVHFFSLDRHLKTNN